MAKKKLREAICRHPHCREPIFWSDFTQGWNHLRTCGRECPNNTVAEPIETGPKDDYQGRW